MADAVSETRSKKHTPATMAKDKNRARRKLTGPLPRFGLTPQMALSASCNRPNTPLAPKSATARTSIWHNGTDSVLACGITYRLTAGRAFLKPPWNGDQYFPLGFLLWIPRVSSDEAIRGYCRIPSACEILHQLYSFLDRSSTKAVEDIAESAGKPTVSAIATVVGSSRL
jgi:hypothetical protein